MHRRVSNERESQPPSLLANPQPTHKHETPQTHTQRPQRHRPRRPMRGPPPAPPRPAALPLSPRLSVRHGPQLHLTVRDFIYIYACARCCFPLRLRWTNTYVLIHPPQQHISNKNTTKTASRGPSLYVLIHPPQHIFDTHVYTHTKQKQLLVVPLAAPRVVPGIFWADS